MVRDAIVIGCGIIGATISAALRKTGVNVLTLDDGRPMSGTKPSGGHIKLSWLPKDMQSVDVDASLETLKSLWGLVTEPYAIRSSNGGMPIVYRVDTDKVISSPRTAAKVVELRHLNNLPLVKIEGGREERCRLLVVAAGNWCSELLPCVSTTAKQGVSFRMRVKIPGPFIAQWAPYKQVVAHQQSAEEIWVGDGSAILPQNWGENRTRDCLNRCKAAVGSDIGYPIRVSLGLRPYALKGEGEPCLLRRLYPRVWVATGAGKNGTIAAGWVANRILREMK